MAHGKKSFVLYCDLIHTVELLDDVLAGKLLKHLLKYVNDENPETNDILLKVAFEPIKRQLKRDLRDWEESAGKRSDAGVLGNLKRWHLDIYEQVISGKLALEQAIEITKHRKTSDSDKCETGAIPIVANIADNVTVTVNDTVTTDVRVYLACYYEKEKIKKESQNFLNMLIPEMMKIWISKKPGYFPDKENDFHACLQIAYKIGDIEKIKKYDIVGDRQLEILKEWEKISSFIISDNWFRKLTLDSISSNKVWQKVINAMLEPHTGKDKPTVNGLEAAREQYLKSQTK